MIIEPNFVVESELVELIALVRKHAAPPGPHKWPAGQCGSLNANLTHLEHPLVVHLERRIADRLGRPNIFAEELRGVWYRPGEGYRLHHDAFYPESEDFNQQVAGRGNRYSTAMIYLNTLTHGGETVFPELGLTIEPRAGLLVAWWNLRRDRSPDITMLHAATPARGADKYIVTQWFREFAT